MDEGYDKINKPVPAGLRISIVAQVVFPMVRDVTAISVVRDRDLQVD
jgi:hypothetical protein